MTPAGAAALRRRLDQLSPKTIRAASYEAVDQSSGRIVSLGAPEVDRRFRRGGLEPGTHEATGDGVAAMGFVGALLTRCQVDASARGLVIQEADALREHGALYAPGLKAIGADPDRLALVQTRTAREALRVADEALRSRAFRMVILELRRGAAMLDLTLTRRFNLAAERAGAFLVLITPALDGTSAALSRWTVGAALSRGPGSRLLGPPAFALGLVKNRAGHIGDFTLEWDCDACIFRTFDPDIRSFAEFDGAPVSARAPAATIAGRSAAA